MSALVIDGTSGDDIIVITATSTNSGSYSINGGGAIAFSGVNSIEVTGHDGNDTLTIVNPAEGVLAPSGGISYQGGGNPADALEVLGGTADAFVYTAGATPDAGTFAYTGAWGTSTLTFAGIAPTVDTVAAANFTINGTAGADAFVVTDGGLVNGFQTTQVSAPTLESIRFANKTNVTINGSGATDTIVFDNPTVAARLVTMNVANVGAVSQIGAVNYTNLSLLSGAVNLNGDNDVTNLAASVVGAGSFTFHDVDDITLTPVGGINGIQTTNGSINIATANGSIFVANSAASADIRAGNNFVNLVAGSVGASDSAVQLDASANITGTGVTISADHIELGIGATISAGSGPVFLAPFTPGTLINLGGSDAANTLGLSDAELDGIGAAGLSIGGVDAGAISFTGAITPAVGTLTLITAADIRDMNAGNDVTVSGLTMVAGTGIGVSGADPLDTTIANLEARTDTGGIGIAEADGISIGDLTAQPGLFVSTSGGINVSANGSIVLADTDSAYTVRAGSLSGAVTLNAIGATSDVFSTVYLDAVGAPAGDITVNAGRDILLGSTGAGYSNGVRANGNATFNAGRDVFVGGISEIISDGFFHNTGGNVSITAGRDISVSDVSGSTTIGADGDGGGDVTLTTGLGGALFLTSNTSTAVFAAGDVIINADRVLIQNDSGITAGAGGVPGPHSVTIQQRSSDWAINLGSAEDSAVSTLELSDAELDRIRTSTLRIGDAANTGDITVTNGITAGSSYTTLALRTDGGIISQLGVTPQLSVQNLALQAGTGIGASSRLETAVQQVAFNSDFGNILIFNASGLTIGPVDSLTSSSSDPYGGGIVVQANGPLTVASDVTAPESIDLQSLDAASAGQDLTVLAGVTVRSTANTIFLDAGDDLTLQAGSTVQALNSIDLFVDGGADPGVGATATLNGTVIAGAFLEVFGRPDNDILIGSAASEMLNGGGGIDTMFGRGGNDVYFVDSGFDQVIENPGEGIDGVNATANYVLPANVEILVLQGAADLQGYGNALTNTLTGNSGNNLLNGAGGADNMIGGAGNDTYFIDNAGDVVTENVNEGNDAVFASISYTLAANVETLILQGSADLQGYGDSAVNTLYGNTGSNLLDGGAGTDTMYGGVGNDVYFADISADAVFENANEGNDSVFASMSFTLLANVENLILQGSADLQGYGNALNNVLYGNTGNNLLNSFAGVDLMAGGAGNDVYFVDDPSDACFEVANQGNDSVFATSSYGLAADVEGLILQGTGDLQAYGNNQANTIYGNSGNNLINAGGGIDLMAGGLGDDVYYVDDPSDVCFEVAGQGNDAVFATCSYGLSADVETLILQGAAGLQGYGNNTANTLYGNAGNNLLNGGGGADTMVGGAGNDVYFVDNAGDGIIENANEGNEAVFAGVSFALGANIEGLVLQGAGNIDGIGNALANSLNGNTGNNTLDGGAGADQLTGNAGNDTFRFTAGQAIGDAVVDFAGNGAAAGDSLVFFGYGGGATFAQVNVTLWQVIYNGGASRDFITFSNGAAIDSSDYSFV